MKPRQLITLGLIAFIILYITKAGPSGAGRVISNCWLFLSRAVQGLADFVQRLS
jgi:hypothetical protein